MFKKKQRLTSRDFKIFFKKRPRKVFFKDLTLFYQENTLNYPRLAIVVSKKNIKKAYKRNLLKRRFRSAFVELLPFFSKKGYDYILMIRSNYTDYKKCVANLTSIAKLISF